MKILVTGGTGFIGNHLCRKLLLDGHTVICLDNNFTGSIKNIRDLLDKPNFVYMEQDVIDTIDLDMDVLDQIYHLACPASPKAYQFDTIKTLKTNFIGTLNILGLAKKMNSRVLLTSTSEVYGDPKISPQSEDYLGNVNPIGIRACYDEGKRALWDHARYGVQGVAHQRATTSRMSIPSPTCRSQLKCATTSPT
jgi:UDP-glucuronate decarboxylase